ncbi:MAG: hypothetical protein WCH43_11200 [Verrucomicrobiota bacterium]
MNTTSFPYRDPCAVCAHGAQLERALTLALSMLSTEEFENYQKQLLLEDGELIGACEQQPV